MFFVIFPLYECSFFIYIDNGKYENTKILLKLFANTPDSEDNEGIKEGIHRVIPCLSSNTSLYVLHVLSIITSYRLNKK